MNITLPYSREDDNGNKIEARQVTTGFYVRVHYGRENTVKLGKGWGKGWGKGGGKGQGKGQGKGWNTRQASIPEGKIVVHNVATKEEVVKIIRFYMSADKFNWGPLQNDTRRLIGQGTYGCVYFPTFTCRGSTEGHPHAVSKVLEKRAANNEENDMKLITDIDPAGKYHWKLLSKCDVPDDIDLKGCNVTFYEQMVKKRLNRENSSMLIYPFGGRTFSDFVSYSDAPRKASIGVLELLAFTNIFKALVVFKKAKFMHNDIKPDNIVFTGGTDKHDPVLLKFIDFGLSMSYEKKFVWTIGDFVYPFYPPQTFLFAHLRHLQSVNHDTIREFAQRWNISSRAFGPETMTQHVIDVLQTDVNVFNSLSMEGRASLVNMMLERHDVYGTGVTLRLALDSFDDSILKIPGFVHNFKEFIRNLTRLEVHKRYSPMQALREYKNILRNIMTYVGSVRTFDASEPLRFLPSRVNKQPVSISPRKMRITDSSVIPTIKTTSDIVDIDTVDNEVIAAYDRTGGSANMAAKTRAAIEKVRAGKPVGSKRAKAAEVNEAAARRAKFRKIEADKARAAIAKVTMRDLDHVSNLERDIRAGVIADKANGKMVKAIDIRKIAKVTVNFRKPEVDEAAARRANIRKIEADKARAAIAKVTRDSEHVPNQIARASMAERNMGAGVMGASVMADKAKGKMAKAIDVRKIAKGTVNFRKPEVNEAAARRANIRKIEADKARAAIAKVTTRHLEHMSNAKVN